MGFDITSDDLPGNIYEGLIISYSVAPVAGIKTRWVTEITHVKPKEYFVDEQRVGPYRMWHHQHFISQVKNGTLMTDIVSYQPPFGIIGSVANRIMISRKLNEIFDYRTGVLSDIFGTD
jgi:ligand-binding SRPBCC domain-containing protein